MITQETIQTLLSKPVEQRKDWVQLDALQTWKTRLWKGTIEAATGVGKSRIGVLAIADEFAVNPNALVYLMVPTTTLKQVDWPAEFEKWGHKDLLKKVKIVCHASMHKTIAKTDIDLLVWDECHHATPKSAIFFSNNKVFKVLGLSATLPETDKNDDDRDKRVILNTFCPSIYKLTIEQAIQLELVADFEVRVLKFMLNNTKVYNWGSAQTPVMRTEQQQYQHLTKNVAKAMYVPKLAGIKYKFISDRVQFLRNLPSKEALARLCMSKMIEPTNRTLIFCGSIKRAEKLCGKNVYHSQTDDTALTAFQNKEINYCGVVDALNEGKNIEDLDQSLIDGFNSNPRVMIQRIGRNIRWRKGHKALIVVLVARGTADDKWYQSAFEDFDKSRIKEYNVKVEL